MGLWLWSCRWKEREKEFWTKESRAEDGVRQLRTEISELEIEAETLR